MAASKFTPAKRAGIIKLIAEGLSMKDAAAAEGVREKTAKNWLSKGRKESSGDYHDFAVVVVAARLAAEERERPMNEEELRKVVSRTARRGSVQAQKLYWEMLGGNQKRGNQETPEAGDPFDALDAGDELAEKRAAKP